MDLDHRDVDRWVVRLDQVVSQVPEEVTKVVARGAFNIKKDAQRRARGIGRHARRYPYSIGYDVYQGLRGPTAEIGPDKNRPQGALGNLLEYGSVNNPPHPHMIPAGAAEAPRFEQALGDLAVRLLEEGR